MDSKTLENTETAEIILPCVDFDETFRFFTERLKFNIFSIFPAENPSVAVIFGYGLRLRLEKDEHAKKQDIQINLSSFLLDETSELTSPNGVNIKFVKNDSEILKPEFKSKFVLNKFADNADWIKGRAEMRYRDLIPSRLGGSLIASHIHIPKGGIIPDYVHFHNIYFQIIYCRKGWAKIVYEDQGEPFLFNLGDCVLQPPKIRHRVLESSDNLEVIEVSSPAEHETFAEHKITLPTNMFNPNRDFNGQNFVHHIAHTSVWENYKNTDFECRDTGIFENTNGLACVKVIRPKSLNKNAELKIHNNKVSFLFMLQGKMHIKSDRNSEYLEECDSLVLPENENYLFTNCSSDLEILEVLI